MKNKVAAKIEQIKARILTACAESVLYDSWTSEYAIKNIKEALSPKKAFCFAKIELISKSDLEELSFSDLTDIGFGNWGGRIALIPLFLKPFIEEDLPVESILGEKTTLKEADTDHHIGFLAFGIAK